MQIVDELIDPFPSAQPRDHRRANLRQLAGSPVAYRVDGAAVAQPLHKAAGDGLNMDGGEHSPGGMARHESTHSAMTQGVMRSRGTRAAAVARG